MDLITLEALDLDYKIKYLAVAVSTLLSIYNSHMLVCFIRYEANGGYRILINRLIKNCSNVLICVLFS